MRIEVSSSLPEFFRRHRELWLSREAEDVGLLRSIKRAHPDDAIGLTVVDASGRVMRTGLLSPQDQLLVSRGVTPEDGSALAEELVRRGLLPPGIFGPKDGCNDVRKALEALTEARYFVVKEMLHLHLGDLEEVGGVGGSVRRGAVPDLDAVVAHRRALQEELNTQRPYDSEVSVREDIAADCLWVWVGKDGEITSSVSAYPIRIPGSCYLDHVYTDPVQRGKGYAANLVHWLCRQNKREGQQLRLSVDASNLPAVNLYRRLGFNLGAEMQNLRRTDPGE